VFQNRHIGFWLCLPPMDAYFVTGFCPIFLRSRY
jgi:hypothetical protein